jgi:hypothetical protein
VDVCVQVSTLPLSGHRYSRQSIRQRSRRPQALAIGQHPSSDRPSASLRGGHLLPQGEKGEVAHVPHPSKAKSSITSITSITLPENNNEYNQLEIYNRDRPQITPDHIDHIFQKSLTKTDGRTTAFVIASVDSGKSPQFFTRTSPIPGQNRPIFVPVEPLRADLRSQLQHRDLRW